jgi:hypothetical protein
VIADTSAVAGGDDELREAAAGFGAELVVAQVARADGTPRHDPDRLAAVYRDIFCNGNGGDAAWR